MVSLPPLPIITEARARELLDTARMRRHSQLSKMVPVAAHELEALCMNFGDGQSKLPTARSVLCTEGCQIAAGVVAAALARPGIPEGFVAVEVESLMTVLEFFKKANWPDTTAGNAASRVFTSAISGGDPADKIRAVEREAVLNVIRRHIHSSHFLRVQDKVKADAEERSKIAAPRSSPN